MILRNPILISVNITRKSSGRISITIIIITAWPHWDEGTFLSLFFSFLFFNQFEAPQG